MPLERPEQLDEMSELERRLQPGTPVLIRRGSGEMQIGLVQQIEGQQVFVVWSEKNGTVSRKRANGEEVQSIKEGDIVGVLKGDKWKIAKVKNLWKDNVVILEREDEQGHHKKMAEEEGLELERGDGKFRREIMAEGWQIEPLKGGTSVWVKQGSKWQRVKIGEVQEDGKVLVFLQDKEGLQRRIFELDVLLNWQREHQKEVNRQREKIKKTLE